eukprot:12682829-Ditylum_brightwellii.AAC.2
MDNLIVTKWQDDNTPTDQEEGNFIPKFNIAPMKKKFGPIDNRKEALVLSIDCKKEDTDYLKMILKEAYGQEDPPYKQFVPHGILQIEGLATYRSILKAQNKFIDNHTAIV